MCVNQFLWSCLDFQKHGYLDKFTLDYFLRDLVQKIRSHEDNGDDNNNDTDNEHAAASVERLRVRPRHHPSIMSVIRCDHNARPRPQTQSRNDTRASACFRDRGWHVDGH